MGFSDKSTRGSTTQTMSGTTHLTQTPTNPAWVDSGLAGLGGTINNLQGKDPYSFISGPDALQTQAGQGAAGLTGTPGTYAGANDLTTSIGQMNAPDIASLMNPFKGAFDNRVINPALAGFDQNAALTNAQDHLNLGRDTTFGGSGAAITDALTRGQQSLARGQLQGGLLSDQYKTALGGATSQAGVNQQQQQLRLNAAGQLVNSANDQGATNRADIATQGGIGSILQALAQAQAGAPMTVAGSLAGIYNTLPLNLLHGQTSDGTSTGTSTGTSKNTTGGMSLADYITNNMEMAAQALGGMSGGGGG